MLSRSLNADYKTDVSLSDHICQEQFLESARMKSSR